MMVEPEELVCRNCGRPIRVRASRCPWCNTQIMVICANCKQYADDSLDTCEHCGEPLEEHDRSRFTRYMGVRPEVAELAMDRERAHLVASGVVAENLPQFFFDDGQRRTVLASIFGSPRTPLRTAQGLLFSAVTYVLEQRYCDLAPMKKEGEMRWVYRKRWDGQLRSLEGLLATEPETEKDFTLPQLLDRVIREAMDFRYETIPPPLVHMPGMPDTPRVRDLSTRTGVGGIVELSRRTVLPEHDVSQASAEIHRLLLASVQVYPKRARVLIRQVRETLDWFVEYEEDHSIVLLREDL